MKSRIFQTLFGALLLIALSTSCKSEFEKIRASGDVQLLYEKAISFYEDGQYQKAQTLFELIINNLRGKVEAEKIYFYYAYTHYHLQKYVLATYYFKNFTNTFPNSEFREEADFMKGYSSYQLSPTYRLDQSYTKDAINDFQLFVNTYPTSERVEECNKLIDECRAKLELKAFSQAELYYDLKQYQSAQHAFENLLQDFPDSRQAETVRFLMTKASYLLAINSVYEKQEERYRDVMASSDAFFNRHPDSKYAKELETIRSNSNKKLNELSND